MFTQMDIYKYVESNTLKEYWKNIHYIPDPMACVYLITYNSDPNISFDTRQKDLKYLAKENKDMPMDEYKPFVRAKTFGEFISKLISTQLDMRANFLSGKDAKMNVRFDSNGNIVEILGGSGTAEEDDILHGFMGIYHDFPHPFAVGDQVKCILPDNKDEYLVLELPRKCKEGESHKDIGDNFIDMSMTLIDGSGEQVFIHVHDLELIRKRGKLWNMK